jgi:hypothetical protein
MPRLKMGEVMPPLLCMPSWNIKAQIHLYFSMGYIITLHFHSYEGPAQKFPFITY